MSDTTGKLTPEMERMLAEHFGSNAPLFGSEFALKARISELESALAAMTATSKGGVIAMGDAIAERDALKDAVAERDKSLAQALEHSDIGWNLANASRARAEAAEREREGLREALERVRTCTARADSGGCEDCQGVAAAALAGDRLRGPGHIWTVIDEARDILGEALYPGLGGDAPKGTMNTLWAFAHEAARRLAALATPTGSTGDNQKREG